MSDVFGNNYLLKPDNDYFVAHNDGRESDLLSLGGTLPVIIGGKILKICKINSISRYVSQP